MKYAERKRRERLLKDLAAAAVMMVIGLSFAVLLVMGLHVDQMQKDATREGHVLVFAK